MWTELEILAAIARTKTYDGKLISAHPLGTRIITPPDGRITAAVLMGLVSLDKPFRLPLEERQSIAACLRRYYFTHWTFDREENGVIIPHKLKRL